MLALIKHGDDAKLCSYSSEIELSRNLYYGEL
jgi:hypothetical protein